MITPNDLPFREIWLIDFEFNPSGREGNPQNVVCMAARELYSGRQIVLWEDELRALDDAPFDLGPEVLFVAFLASAEWGCFLDLGWTMPSRVLDLYVEARVELNKPKGYPGCYPGLLALAQRYKLASMIAEEKEEMRDLILSCGPWNEEEKQSIKDYCLEDVLVLERIFPCFIRDLRLDQLRLQQALNRGRYTVAVARIERAGVPLDAIMLRRIMNSWDEIKERLVIEVNPQYEVYEGASFREKKFEKYLARQGITWWPRTDTGRLVLESDVFRTMADCYPQLRELYELRVTLATFRQIKLSVGDDGRNRCLLSIFRSVTGRNQPKGSRHIFGPARWLRGLIKPDLGRAVAYLDWSGQELAIAAALSGDPILMKSYNSGDLYMDFAERVGMVPPGATKSTHSDERTKCKAIVLGINYGMGAEGLSKRAGVSVLEAKMLLRQHKTIYSRFWQWSRAVVNQALLERLITTNLGWKQHIPKELRVKEKSLMNFPMQAHGAEMMRLAACVATEAGIQVCTPVHDAFLIEAPVNQIDEVVKQMKEIMEAASEIVMGVPGFRCRVDADVVVYPNRYEDGRGRSMWERVVKILDCIDIEQPALGLESGVRSDPTTGLTSGPLS